MEKIIPDDPALRKEYIAALERANREDLAAINQRLNRIHEMNPEAAQQAFDGAIEYLAEQNDERKNGKQ